MEKKGECATIMETCKPLIKQSKIYIRRKSVEKNYNCLIIINLITCVLSIVSLSIFWFTDIYNQILLQNIILKTDSKMLKWYFNPPIDKLIKVYLFNYTNIDKFMNGNDSKIHISEIGPYVYKEYTEKINVHTEGYRITFRENRTHEFIKEMSGDLTEHDVIHVPNIALISAIPNVNKLGIIARIGFNTILGSTKPREFKNITVKDYLFGHTDKFMEAISKIKWNFNSKDVAILSARNGVTASSMTINSGIKDSADVGKISAIGSRERTNIWKSEKCNKIEGSDGVFYGPSLVRNKQSVDVYLPDICRSLPLEFKRKKYVLENIPAYLYAAPENVFSVGHKSYCELTSVNHNHTNGVLEISDCIDGSPPLFISHPHFLEGDEKLFRHIEGMKPNRSLHNSYVYLHPRFSVPLVGVSRMQLNLKVHHFKKYYNSLPEGLILPLSWVETTTSENIPDNFKFMIFLSTVMANHIEIFFKYAPILTFLLSSSCLAAFIIKCKFIN